MIREQAYQSMKEGNKVTHKCFVSSYYYQIVDGNIVDKGGFNVIDPFYEYTRLKDGWEIYIELKLHKHEKNHLN